MNELAFQFFYKFSRFEYALKKSGILKSESEGANAEPGWSKFVSKHKNNYRCSEASRRLIELNPKVQKVGENRNLVWEQKEFHSNVSELEKVVSLLKTTRNNLFHGGKSDISGWAEPERTVVLLECGVAVLTEMAEIIEAEDELLLVY